MAKCIDCGYYEGAGGSNTGETKINCFRRGRFMVTEGVHTVMETERECAEFFKKIRNLSPKEVYALQREEQLKGKEFAYTEKALELSSEANKISREANKLSYDSRLLAWVAILVSVLTFFAKYFVSK